MSQAPHEVVKAVEANLRIPFVAGDGPYERDVRVVGLGSGTPVAPEVSNLGALLAERAFAELPEGATPIGYSRLELDMSDEANCLNADGTMVSAFQVGKWCYRLFVRFALATAP